MVIVKRYQNNTKFYGKDSWVPDSNFWLREKRGEGWGGWGGKNLSYSVILKSNEGNPDF